MWWGNRAIGSPAGVRLPSALRCCPPALSFRDRSPCHARPNSRKTFPVAHTRQVTVTRIICGVDVSSVSLAARIGRDGMQADFPNSQQGSVALAAFCRAHQDELVAMEATGGYEQQPFALLWAEGLSVAILNPRQVRRFAEGMGVIEKTDAIDAGLIAWFAQVRSCAPSPAPAPDQQHRRAL